MDKLNLHDTLRIYLPGLLICILIYWFSSGTLKEVGDVALPAVFVGVFLDPFLRKLDEIFYNKFVVWKKIDISGKHETTRTLISYIIQFHLRDQYQIYADKFMNSNLKRKYFIISSLYTRLHGNDNLSVFRSQRSYGLLCFNASIACLGMSFLIFFNYILSYPLWDAVPFRMQIAVNIVIFLVGLLFLLGSTVYYTTGLKLEAKFWMQLTNNEVEMIKKLIDMCEKLDNA